MTTIIKRNKFEIWRDVIFALFVREIRVGFNDKFGLSWSVINPVIFIFALSFLRSSLGGSDTHTIPTFTFMAIGLLLIQMFLHTLSAVAKAISSNKPLYAFRQVQPISPVIASALFELLVKIFIAVFIVILMYFMKMELKIDDPLLFIGHFFLLWLLAVSVGLLCGIMELFIEELKKVRELFTRPLFFISGVFFSLQDIPKEYWYLLDWNPILHAIELLRYSVYASYGSIGVSSIFLVSITLIFTFFSLSVYFAYWKRAISR